MDMMQPDMAMPEQAEAGRGTDSVLAHLSLGEVVIPRAFLDDPAVMQALQQIFQAGGADMAQYTVGDPSNSINPETGHPEFFFKKLKKLVKIAAPLALSYFAPGLGTAIGTGLGATVGAGASTLGNALLGAGIGAATGGGLKGAAIGALSGGVGANIGSLAGPELAAGQFGPPDLGSGILGQVSKATGLNSSSLGGIGNLVGGSGGGSSFGGLNTLSSAFGGLQQDSALKKQKQQLLASQNQQLANLENLNPTDVQNDPGYQFAQQQGEQGLNRSLGARGMVFSGDALKEAAGFNQGLASQFYGDAYQRQANKVGEQNNIYGNTGNINANATMSRSNNINQGLANAFGGNVGNYSGTNISGGQLSNQQLLDLLRQRGLA